MKKMIKRIIAVLLTITVLQTALFSTSSFSVSATESNGNCGSNATWSYNSNTKTLLIAGSGVIKNYNRIYNPNFSTANGSGYYTTTPWWPYHNEIEHLIIGEGITTVGEWCFYDNNGIKSVSLPSTLTTIKNRAFHCFSGNFGEIVFPESLQVIGEYAFDGSDITRLVVPGSLKNISFGAFHYCDLMEEVIIKDGCTAIGQYAFNNCLSLSDITIPNSVSTIGLYAFCRLDPCDGWYAYSGYDGLCIYGENGAYAQTYAKDNGINFVSITPSSEQIDNLYVYLANNCPEYLDNYIFSAFYSNSQALCNDAIQEYNDVDNHLLAFAESFVNGTSIIIKNLAAQIGIGQSTQDEWLEKNTISFMQTVANSDRGSAIIEQVWKETKQGYKDFKFVYDSFEDVSKATLINEISKSSSVLSYNTIKSITDDVYNNLSIYGLSTFFDTTGMIVDGADLVVYSCQLYEIELNLMYKIRGLVTKDSTLYEGLTKLINDRQKDPTQYILGKYFASQCVKKITKDLSKFGKWSMGKFLGTNINVTMAIVKFSATVLYDYVYHGPKIDEIYGAIVAYDFYSSITASYRTKLSNILSNKLNGISNSAELLANYKFLFEARRGALENYVDSCIAIENHDDRLSLLMDVKDSIDNGLISFDKYIENCIRLLRNDISKGTVFCSHCVTHIIDEIHPTCTTKGYIKNICDICSTIYLTNESNPYGHSFLNYISNNNSTCTNDGTKTAKCERCSATNTITDYGSALGHNYKSMVVSPKCTTHGYTAFTCIRCGNSYNDNYITATGHTFCDWTTTTPASCSTDSVETRTCTKNCGEESATETRVIPATGHTIVIDKGIDATCTKSGISEGSHCLACGAVIVAQVIIPASGHMYDTGTDSADYHAKLAPTCTTDGYEAYYKCKNCEQLFDVNGNKISEPKIIHKYHCLEGAMVIHGVMPTYSTDGSLTYYRCPCNSCINGTKRCSLTADFAIVDTETNIKNAAKLDRLSKSGGLPMEYGGLTLDGEIGFNLYFDDIDAYLDAYGITQAALEIYGVDAFDEDGNLIDGAQPIAVMDSNNRGYSGTGSFINYYCPQNPITVRADQMNSKIAIMLYDTSGGNKTLVEDFRDGGIMELTAMDMLKQYVDTFENDDQIGSKEIAQLCKACITYGGYATSHFDKTDYKDPGESYSLDISTVTQEKVDAIPNMYKNGAATGFTINASSFIVEAKSAIRFYYTLADGQDISNYTVSATIGGVAVDSSNIVISKSNNNKDYIQIINIGAGELSKELIISVTNNSDLSTMEASYNALCYAKNMINNAAANQRIKNLCKAIILYSNAADAYAAVEKSIVVVHKADPGELQQDTLIW